MALHNAQYDTIMREYNRKQSENRRLLEERRQEISVRIPEIRALDAEIARVGAAAARSLLNGSGTVPGYSREVERIEEQKKELLTENGYPADYLEMPYTCPLCRDTGFIDGQKCSCFRQAELRLLYRQSGLESILKKETFDRFSFDWYSDTIINSSTGLSARETARNAYQVCRGFVRDFDHSSQNLFLYGDTGVGKTFLSHCIAGELLESSHSVLYFSAYDLFEMLARHTFDQQQAGEEQDSLWLTCDLLIIDDLGTELTNSFVSSQLFTCISERILGGKSTIISTNLTLQDFSDTYSERTFSRIVGSYTMVKLIGKDIRFQQKTSGGK